MHTSEHQTRARATRASEARRAASGDFVKSDHAVHFCVLGRPSSLPLCGPKQTSLAEGNGFAQKG